MYFQTIENSEQWDFNYPCAFSDQYRNDSLKYKKKEKKKQVWTSRRTLHSAHRKLQNDNSDPCAVRMVPDIFSNHYTNNRMLSNVFSATAFPATAFSATAFSAITFSASTFQQSIFTNRIFSNAFSANTFSETTFSATGFWLLKMQLLKVQLLKMHC